jgi:CheY-like chemotaxis protein
MTILNVDDHAPARFLRTRILERAGYGVAEAGTAADAIERAADATLLLLDVKLPDADGFSVCERVKKNRPMLPVVLVTSVYRTAQARRDAFAVGADAFLLEPIEPSMLVRTVDELVAPNRNRVTKDPALEAWVITDASGLIEDLSDEAAAMLNLSRRGARSRNLTSFFTDNRSRLIAELLRAADGLVIERGAVIQPRDRRPFGVHIDIAVVPHAPGERVRLRWTLLREES